jgi:hypothetical protein
MRRFNLFSVLLLGSMTTLTAENWPNWRGPSSTGVSGEASLPSSWSDTENIAWKATIRGLGISSPIVWGDSVFVTSQVGTGVARSGPRLVQNEDAAGAGERALGGAATGAIARGTATTVFLVTAFDRATGRQLWEYELPAEGALPEVHEKHNLATPSPVTEGQRVYAWFGTGQLIALDMSGKPKKVPEVTPETEEEKKLYDSALRRRQLRLILGGKMKPGDATELKALFMS